MANPEAQLKALDKRMGGVERKLDELEKLLRKSGSGMLEKRVGILEKALKMMLTHNMDTKKGLQELKTGLNDKLTKEMERFRQQGAKNKGPADDSKIQAMEKKISGLIVLIDKKTDQVEKKATAAAEQAAGQAAKAERENTLKAMLKMSDDHAKKAMEQALKAQLEGRLKAIEAQAQAAMAAAAQR